MTKEIKKCYTVLLFVVLVCPFAARSQETPYSNDACERREINVNGTPYPICIFRSDGNSSNNGNVTVYYIPAFLFIERADRVGVHYSLHRSRSDSKVKNILNLNLLLDDPALEDRIRQTFGLKESVRLKRVNPKHINVRMRIPGTDTWLETRPVDDESLETFGRMAQLNFQLNYDQTESVIDQLQYGTVEFQINFQYFTKTPTTRRGIRLSGYLFPDDLLKIFFGSRNEVDATEWQLFDLWSKGERFLQAKIFLERDEDCSEYRDIFLTWAASLRVSSGESEIEKLRRTLHTQDPEQLLSEHQLVIKARNHASDLSEEEHRKLKNISLVRVRKNVITRLQEDVLDLTSYLESLGQIVVNRNSSRDRIQVMNSISLPHSDFKRFSFGRNLRPFLTNKTNESFDGSVLIFLPSAGRIRVEKKHGKWIDLNLSPSEEVRYIEEAPEESCVRIYIDDLENHSGSQFCFDRMNLNLIYQRLFVDDDGIEIILEPPDIFVQKRERPTQAPFRFKNIGNVPISRIYFSIDEPSAFYLEMKNGKNTRYEMPRFL